ncbi:hypothetical protein F2Q70_00041755 [Brassica cretica]|uniref:Methionine aminopeptidase n=1 Tax=Brassica cretica TaxID=69181 RepID=A0A8S9KBE0_BRACR|nr:hypothetical protein F2Q70_00041755 [Brassica cretica]
MASTVFLSTFSSAHLSSSFVVEVLYPSLPPLLYRCSPSLLSLGKKNSYPLRKFHVSAKKVSGLEEAIRIRRMREAEATSKVKRNPPLRRGRIPSPDGLVKMRAACELAARVLNFAGTLVKSGDIINIDVTVYLDGYHGDTSRTFFCGEVDEGFKRLVKVTEECLEKGIAVCKDGASFKKIGKRISEHAEKYGYNVVERFVGHGVGPVFHSEPLIYHYRNDEPGHMVEGQTFTIEPILTIGTTECVTWPDNWTTLTADGGVAAQFEHTILITRTDKAVHDMIVEAGAYPSPLGYGGFPKSVCTSVNECMCHGIPDSQWGYNYIDVTVYLDGYHGDTSRTFFCGEVNEGFKRLVKVTEECLEKGIAVCKDGANFKKIGKRISEHAEKYGYNVVERFVGHGVGPVFHSEPLIYHYRNDEPGHMVEGQTFTIEPILTIGTTECVTWPDNWTTLTADGGVAAQFEHTILITRTGSEILTIC